MNAQQWTRLLALIVLPLALLLPAGCGSGITIDPGPPFTKEGDLSFLRTPTTLAEIDIEIADTADERATGLMNRTSLPSDAGMLFIFPTEQNVSFWMKDTLIPLDMVFVNDAKVIINIARNTVPLSETLIPSGGPTRYVVEVNAGFCLLHNINVGDTIDFTQL
jgi:uncharacterized membrane protein (UPF0127 family)